MYKLVLETIDQLSDYDFLAGQVYEDLNIKIVSSIAAINAFETTMIGDKANLVMFLREFYNEDEEFFKKYSTKIY